MLNENEVIRLIIKQLLESSDTDFSKSIEQYYDLGEVLIGTRPDSISVSCIEVRDIKSAKELAFRCVNEITKKIGTEQLNYNQIGRLIIILKGVYLDEDEKIIRKIQVSLRKVQPDAKIRRELLKTVKEIFSICNNSGNILQQLIDIRTTYLK